MSNTELWHSMNKRNGYNLHWCNTPTKLLHKWNDLCFIRPALPCMFPWEILLFIFKGKGRIPNRPNWTNRKQLGRKFGSRSQVWQNVCVSFHVAKHQFGNPQNSRRSWHNLFHRDIHTHILHPFLEDVWHYSFELLPIVAEYQ